MKYKNLMAAPGQPFVIKEYFNLENIMPLPLTKICCL